MNAAPPRGWLRTKNSEFRSVSHSLQGTTDAIATPDGTGAAPSSALALCYDRWDVSIPPSFPGNADTRSAGEWNHRPRRNDRAKTGRRRGRDLHRQRHQHRQRRRPLALSADALRGSFELSPIHRSEDRMGTSPGLNGPLAK